MTQPPGPHTPGKIGGLDYPHYWENKGLGIDRSEFQAYSHLWKVASGCGVHQVKLEINQSGRCTMVPSGLTQTRYAVHPSKLYIGKCAYNCQYITTTEIWHKIYYYLCYWEHLGAV